MEDTLAPPSLFELLARSWPLGAAVVSAGFNHAGTAVAFACADGRAAAVPLADADAPGKRIRIEFDTGRTTIRPRSQPVPPPTLVGLPGGVAAPLLAPFGAQGFCLAAADGSLHRVTARGQILRLGAPAADAVSALTGAAGSEVVAVARGTRVGLLDGTGAETAEAVLAARVGALGFAPDGTTLAAGHGVGVTLLDAGRGLAVLCDLPLPAPVLTLAFDGTGSLLACSLADRSVAVITLATGAVARLDGFPEQPATLGFSTATGALVASGAYRLAAWSMRPDGTVPLKTGRAGLVLVDRVAPHPSRPIAAAGYASGLLILSHLGQPGEALLRAGTSGSEAAVTALVWSGDGRHLAMGTASGEAAVITFPDQFFK